ncbi:MAG: hypothetical protein WD876_01565, partial [Candidatus Pacearchaeota archaeon]
WPLSCLFVYDNKGISLNNFPVCGDYINFKTGFSGIPTISNMDDDPEMEISANSFAGGWYVNGLGALYVINYDGTITEGFPKYLDDNIFGNIASASDLNNDGTNELILGTWRGTAFVYNLHGQTGNDSWPQFQHDAQHTGCYDCDGNTKQDISNTSKIENLGKGSVEMVLSIKIQRFESNGNVWQEYYGLANDRYVLLPGESLNLTELFNGKNVEIPQTGIYRVNVTATDFSGKAIASSAKEFNVTIGRII